MGAEISGSIHIKSGDEYSLMAAVANAGPVAVGVDASSKAFRVRTMHAYNYFNIIISCFLAFYYSITHQVSTICLAAPVCP